MSLWIIHPLPNSKDELTQPSFEVRAWICNYISQNLMECNDLSLPLGYICVCKDFKWNWWQGRVNHRYGVPINILLTTGIGGECRGRGIKKLKQRSHELVRKIKNSCRNTPCLTHWGLVMPCGGKDLGQHWRRQWLVARRHHYLKQCWLIISEILWYPHEDNYKRYLSHQLLKFAWQFLI